MTLRRIALTSSVFLVLFIVQETIVNQINFMIGGFSFYLASVLTWIIRESKNGSFVAGFIAGLILDFSPNIESPFGQWTLILTIVGFSLSLNKENLNDLSDRPFLSAIVIAIAVSLTLVLFILINTIFSETNISLPVIVRELSGNFLWTLFLAPIYAPLMGKVQKLTLSSKERR